MLKIGAVSLVGMAFLGWFVLGPGQQLETNPPPTIRAEVGPIKHRPEGYASVQNQPQATPIFSRQVASDAPAGETYYRLNR